MKISHNWLKHYLTTDKSPEEIAEVLPLLGFDIESIERSGPPPMENVVVGEVLAFSQHPDADRLRVCQVRTGSEGAPHTIVCGAKNFVAGDHVMVALPGAVLPGDFKIKKSKLRGVASEGMMCSASELQAGDDHDGIMIVDKDVPLGTPLNHLYQDADTIFDVEVTPNRPDCLSHIGIARELAAKLGVELKLPEVHASTETPLIAGEIPLIDGVAIESTADCAHYTATCVRGVTVTESPLWLKQAVEAIGLRPINNVVDVTNYVLHETGQPLHAFDAKKIRGRNLLVRYAAQGETITTLDGVERTLDSRMMVIADAERPLVVAGVMGSVDAEVDANTTDLVLEAAWFNPASIRRTSRGLGVSSDSAYRFERGVDPDGAIYAALRAIDLILEVAGGAVSGAMLQDGSRIETVSEVTLTPDWIRRQIGFSISDEEMIEVLESVEFEVSAHDTPVGGKSWVVGIPSFRGDVTRPVDVIEEIVRIYGTDRIPETAVRVEGVSAVDSRIYTFNESAAHYLTGMGFDEAFLYSLRGPGETLQWAGESGQDKLRLANPLASDQSHLRTSLLPGLLDVLQLNHARGTGAARFFERGRVFRESEGRVYELVAIAFVIRDTKDERAWRSRESADYFTAKRICEELLATAGMDPAKQVFLPAEASGGIWQAGHAAVAGDFTRKLGLSCGLLDVRLLKAWDIDQPVVAGELVLLPRVIEKPQRRPRFEPISLFPASTKDLALVVDRGVLAATVEAELRAIAEDATGDFELEDLQLFDTYEGTGLPDDAKSLAFSMRFRSRDRTLKDKEVNATFAKIQERIASTTAYQVRS